MRDDGWDDEIIVLSSLRKIILSSEYYEPAYDTSIGNFTHTWWNVRLVKCGIIECSTRNTLWNESNDSTILQCYYLITKLYVIKDLGDI